MSNPSPSNQPQALAPEQAAAQAQFQAALTGSLARFYVNAFALAMTPSDIIVTMLCNGLPVGMVNMPVSVAKSPGEDLGKTTAEFERATSQSVKSLKEAAEEMQRAKIEQYRVLDKYNGY